MGKASGEGGLWDLPSPAPPCSLLPAPSSACCLDPSCQPSSNRAWRPEGLLHVPREVVPLRKDSQIQDRQRDFSQLPREGSSARRCAPELPEGSPRPASLRAQGGRPRSGGGLGCSEALRLLHASLATVPSRPMVTPGREVVPETLQAPGSTGPPTPPPPHTWGYKERRGGNAGHRPAPVSGPRPPVSLGCLTAEPGCPSRKGGDAERPMLGLAALSTLVSGRARVGGQGAPQSQSSSGLTLGAPGVP